MSDHRRDGSTNVTRRELLKLTAAGGAGLTLDGLLDRLRSPDFVPTIKLDAGAGDARICFQHPIAREMDARAVIQLDGVTHRQVL